MSDLRPISRYSITLKLNILVTREKGNGHLFEKVQIVRKIIFISASFYV